VLKEENEKAQDPSGNVKLSYKIYINQNPSGVSPRHNVVGRILGPAGSTIKRMQSETHCKIAILGTGSMRDKSKEDELRKSGDPKYDHLNDRLHVMIEAQGSYDVANARRAAGIAEVQKMLIPPVPGEDDPMEVKYKSGMGDYRSHHPPHDHHRHRPPPPPPSRRMDHGDRPKPGYSNGGGYGGSSGYSSFSDYGDDWAPGSSSGGGGRPPSHPPSYSRSPRGGPPRGRGGRGRGGGRPGMGQRYQPY
jgi:hypothetical protein